jgi:hypothetical protein
MISINKLRNNNLRNNNLRNNNLDEARQNAIEEYVIDINNKLFELCTYLNLDIQDIKKIDKKNYQQNPFNDEQKKAIIQAIKIQEEIDRDFESALITMPVLASKELAAVGYNGFRQGTQIDPIWNAYLLALVVCIGKEVVVGDGEEVLVVVCNCKEVVVFVF